MQLITYIQLELSSYRNDIFYNEIEEVLEEELEYAFIPLIWEVEFMLLKFQRGNTF